MFPVGVLQSSQFGGRVSFLTEQEQWSLPNVVFGIDYKREHVQILWASDINDKFHKF